MTDHKDIAKVEKPMSERFMEKVVAEFGGSVGTVALTDFQKRLAQNYFISIDATLRAAEEKRQSNAKKKNDPPIVWANVNMPLLAQNVVAAARIGLDPAQKNHINMIPYKNNATQKYDIGFLEGYRGIELKAVKYGLDIPDAVIVELVYSNDRFKPIKKDHRNPIESYEFEITNAFDRGQIVGGFYYHAFAANPEKNKLVVFTLKDIEKRKPQYASVEFWGGEKTVWKDGKPAGKEKVDGWYEQMCHKTIYRAAYGNLTIDSQKIDNDYMRLRQMERDMKEAAVAAEIAANANTETIDIKGESVTDVEPPDNIVDITPAEPEPLPPTGTTGPSF
ncbi:hypothetical protein [Sporomusa sphaeroides]|uniref:hypothetical protein n=1 Tax=Sporomusa sphaeroides TaxID=47679 RepID=UPI00202DDEB8|nr:hypothetical protein [Sporomusa sphaeroides]MCM0757419.1 hypothetical protein [Sporomusa sphaeroides DSM 2875]HML33813.1 hypothetical protein [Sporomusa sphaeroides]